MEFKIEVSGDQWREMCKNRYGHYPQRYAGHRSRYHGPDTRTSLRPKGIYTPFERERGI